ncbi:hypothetical protein HDU78_001726 [Chytriomyces hyalinus]|nr:hypothetical protein HDU78_001726 [Chytriomyces hyalinus]
MHINTLCLLAWSACLAQVSSQSLTDLESPNLGIQGEMDWNSPISQQDVPTTNADGLKDEIISAAVEVSPDANALSSGSGETFTDAFGGIEPVPTAADSFMAEPAPTITSLEASTTAAASEEPVDILSIVSVIVNLIPNVVNVVFTISSMAATSDPCASDCLSTIGNVSDPTSLVLFCKNSDQIATCQSECPSNSYLHSLISACSRAVPALGQASQSKGLSPSSAPAPPSPAASARQADDDKPAVDPLQLLQSLGSLGIAVSSGASVLIKSATNTCLAECINKIPSLDVTSSSSVKVFCNNKRLSATCSRVCPNSALLSSLTAQCETLMKSSACQSECLDMLPAVNSSDSQSVTAFCSNKQLLNTCTSVCSESTLFASIANECSYIVPTGDVSPLQTSRPMSASRAYGSMVNLLGMASLTLGLLALV